MAIDLKKLIKPGLSIATAPLKVNLRGGMVRYYTSTRDIRKDYVADEVISVYDRRKKINVDPFAVTKHKRNRK